MVTLTFLFALVVVTAIVIPPNLCGAMTSAGTPCRRACIRGGTRCVLHGGGSPEARRVAEEMLAVARVPAARVLLQIIEDWLADFCEVCGRPKGNPSPVINAAKAVLDRTGLHPSMMLQVSRLPEPEPWAEWLTTQELQQVESFVQSAKGRMSRGERRPAWVEADVIEVETQAEPETTLRLGPVEESPEETLKSS